MVSRRKLVTAEGEAFRKVSESENLCLDYPLGYFEGDQFTFKTCNGLSFKPRAVMVCGDQCTDLLEVCRAAEIIVLNS